MVDNAHGWQGREPASLDPWDTSSMASANLYLVRSIFEAWEHGDFSSVEWAHPEIAEPEAGDFTHGEWADPQTP